jgi:hypothetical protein
VIDNHEVTMPQTESPGDVSAYLDIERTSGRESSPNPLHNLITIYNEEERSEVSLVKPRRHLPQLPMLKFKAFHRMTRRSKVS